LCRWSQAHGPLRYFVRRDRKGGTELDGAGDLAFLAKRVEALFLSAPNMVENTLRQAIVDGVLVGGQKLRQFELAATFGVSRVPGVSPSAT
jgi:hypothetical protein